jgi:hypothetical protein
VDGRYLLHRASLQGQRMRCSMYSRVLLGAFYPVLPLSSSEFTQFLRGSGYSHVNDAAWEFMKALKHSIHRVFLALL